MGDYSFKETVLIPYETVKQWSTEIYKTVGMIETDAAIVAKIQAVADLRGVYSHGVQRCGTYVERLLRKATNPIAQPVVEVDAKAYALVNGNNAMGQIVAHYAANLAIAKASEYGCSTISIKGSNHIGTMAYYAMMAAKQDMIGICMTQGAGNCVAPWGGSEKLLGNNPFGFAVPASNYPPVVLDMAQSVVAFGKLDMARTTGVSIPDNWALDKDGNPTTDPNKFYTLQPIGGYKGYGLSFIITLLCAVLPDVPYGREQVDLFSTTNEPQNGGQLIQVINIGALMDVESFKKRVDRAIDMVKSSNRSQGVDEILVPGEPEARTEKQQLETGIKYPIELVDKLRELSSRLKVSVPF